MNPRKSYAKYPELSAAWSNLIECRITMSLHPSAESAAILRRAGTLFRKTRAKYKDAIHNDKIQARIDAIRSKRYASQRAKRSRTLDTAAETREHRQARRQRARQATEQKRADNQRAHGYTSLSSKSARTNSQFGDMG